MNNQKGHNIEYTSTVIAGIKLCHIFNSRHAGLLPFSDKGRAKLII